MSPTSPGKSSGPVYRIDRFVVPVRSLPEFLGRVRWIQRHLSTLEGCGQNLVLEQTSGPGQFNVVTLVEWVSHRAMANARIQVEEHYRQKGFDPQAFLASRGVQADMGTYAAAIAS